MCLKQLVSSLSSPPELVSKLLDPWEQQEHASSRRIATLVNEIAGDVRNGHKQVVVLDAPGVRAMGVGTPQRAPRSTPGAPAAPRGGAAQTANAPAASERCPPSVRLSPPAPAPVLTRRVGARRARGLWQE